MLKWGAPKGSVPLNMWGLRLGPTGSIACFPARQRRDEGDQGRRGGKPPCGDRAAHVSQLEPDSQSGSSEFVVWGVQALVLVEDNHLGW